MVELLPGAYIDTSPGTQTQLADYIKSKGQPYVGAERVHTAPKNRLAPFAPGASREPLISGLSKSVAQTIKVSP